MRCAFSTPPLRALIDAGHEIAGVVLPGPPFGPAIVPQPAIPTLRLSPLDQPTWEIEALAAHAKAPVLNAGNLGHVETISAISRFEPDVIAVACFPFLIPSAMLRIPKLGCLNVHPSLLPRGRGPEPLFWTFRRGEPETGVTVHLMDDRFDAGPVLLQRRVEIPEGIRLPDLEFQLAEFGGTLLVEAIDQFATDSATPVPQDDAEATTAPIPTLADYKMPTDLPARWAFNFARAVAPTTNCLKVVIMATKEEIEVADAVSYRNSDALGAPYQSNENRVTVRFLPGSVTFSLPFSANSKS